MKANLTPSGHKIDGNKTNIIFYQCSTVDEVLEKTSEIENSTEALF